MQALDPKTVLRAETNGAWEAELNRLSQVYQDGVANCTGPEGLDEIEDEQDHYRPVPKHLWQGA